MEEDKSQSLNKFLLEKGQIVDLRTPSEYQNGHIPTAINVPIFTDEERNEVGKIFKLQGPFKATQIGLQYMGPKLSDIVTQLKEADNFPIKVYCSRGGMRSQAMVWLLNFCRINAISLRNGYKSYRRGAQDFFSKSFDLHLIQPSLGTSIQIIIDKLKKENKQVLDLEEIANLSLDFLSEVREKQPTTEHFENLIVHRLNQMDVTKPIWVQNVGKEVGQCVMPPKFLNHFRTSPLYLIKEEKEKRIEDLSKKIEKMQKEVVYAQLKIYKKKLGFFKYKQVLEAFNLNGYNQVANVLIDHFDKIAFFYLKKHKGNLISCSRDELEAISS